MGIHEGLAVVVNWGFRCWTPQHLTSDLTDWWREPGGREGVGWCEEVVTLHIHTRELGRRKRLELWGGRVRETRRSWGRTWIRNYLGYPGTWNNGSWTTKRKCKDDSCGTWNLGQSGCCNAINVTVGQPEWRLKRINITVGLPFVHGSHLRTTCSRSVIHYSIDLHRPGTTTRVVWAPEECIIVFYIPHCFIIATQEDIPPVSVLVDMATSALSHSILQSTVYVVEHQLCCAVFN